MALRISNVVRAPACIALVAWLAACGDGLAASPGADLTDGGALGALGAGGDLLDGPRLTAVTGLPCDVAEMLQTKCVACHSSPPYGAPMPLVTYADLTSRSISDPSMTRAQLSLARIQNATAPMPPPGNPAPTPAEVASFQAWVNAGTPTGACAALDAGPVTSPYATPVQCTSATMWTGGNDGKGTMRPGGACISCHATSGGEAPTFTIAGTVYPTAHEPNDCNGVGSAAATVVITDAAGKVLSLSVNSAGNFYSSQRVALPFHAKVVAGGKERAMGAAQTSGDCNLCHTETGAMSAPGRIMTP